MNWGRGSSIVLLAVVAVFWAGCADVLAPPGTPETGAVLRVRIAGGGAGRTALPAMPGIASYAITVSRGGKLLGSLTAPATDAEFPVPLSALPQAGDLALVEGFDAVSKKCAEGKTELPSGYTPGSPVTIAMSRSREGAGSVDLKLNLALAPGDLTAAELSLYRSLQDYQGGRAYSFKRFRKDSSYGAGEDLGAIVPIKFDSLPSGNYVAQLEFFRLKYVRVSRLMQTIIVREGLVTDRWDDGSDTLDWGADKFASSDANLAGLSIASAPPSFSFSPTTYDYNIAKPYPVWPATFPEISTLSITPGRAGQKIEAKLNGTAVSSGNNLVLNPHGANSLVVTVTAPDRVTKQTYTVSYSYYYDAVLPYPPYDKLWYVSESGHDGTGLGTAASPFKTVGKALDAIKLSYSIYWPGKVFPPPYTPVAARIHISGNITEAVEIKETGALYATLPPILLEGTNATITGPSSPTPTRPLTIDNGVVILGDGITITGGPSSGSNGAVYLRNSSSFTMNGGTISGNWSSGVIVTGSNSFTMNSGTISGNQGGGVLVASTSSSTSSFIMNGGAISGNSDVTGGGVYVGKNGVFTMNGGIIGGTIPGEANTATSSYGGGGVFVDTDGEFKMTGGTISGNTATSKGGGVSVDDKGAFTMTGGTISGNGGNKAAGVYVSGSGTSFVMTGGTISGNTASDSGGGVYVTGGGEFTLTGGTVGGNTASNGGGGVYVDTGSEFEMAGGSVSGNTATGDGGGVYVASGATFTMHNGSISGNTANHEGGGVNVKGTFAMNGGAIKNNSSIWSGGGVLVGSGAQKTIYGDVSDNNSLNTENDNLHDENP